MKALYLNSPAQQLMLGETERPRPQSGQLLVKVYAAGVTMTELDWYPTTHTKSGNERRGAIPGHEFSGIIAEVGNEVKGFVPGLEIYGMNDWFEQGATAEYCVTLPSNVAEKPANLTHTEAATVPIAALTAWQGLFERAKLRAGERVLVHGGAGAVGLFVTQLAHLHGGYVIATTSPDTRAFVQSLGAGEVIDYKRNRFEEIVHDIDVVFDTVGGETRERSWTVLKPGGRLISIAADGEVTTNPKVRDAYFIVEPIQSQLIEVAKLLDDGTLRTFINAVVPLADAATAYSGAIAHKRGYGKSVVKVAGDETGMQDRR